MACSINISGVIFSLSSQRSKEAKKNNAWSPVKLNVAEMFSTPRDLQATRIVRVGWKTVNFYLHVPVVTLISFKQNFPFWKCVTEA